jgi:hypothetical protein
MIQPAYSIAQQRVAPAHEAPPGDACPNCHALLHGAFCSACGQKRPEASDLTVRAFVSHAADELVSADSKLLGTLRTLFTAPGQLTVDWREGRRARWIAPLRLYLVTSAVYYLTVFDLTREQTTNQFVDILAKTVALTGMLSAASARANMLAQFETVTTVTSFSGALVLAVLATLCLRRPRRPFAEHFVGMLHYSAFAWVTGTAGYAAWWWVGDAASLGWVSLALMLVSIVYLALQLRRSERLSTGRAVAWTVVLFSANYVVEVLLMTFGMLFAAFVPA